MRHFDRAIYGSSWAFADTWLLSDRDGRFVNPKPRNLRADVVANCACPECGAERGQPCTRMTVGGMVFRRLPHVGRSTPRRIVFSGRPEIEG